MDMYKNQLDITNQQSVYFKKCYNLFIYFYLKGRDKQGEKYLPPVGLLPKCLQKLGLGQAEARNLEFNPQVFTGLAGTQILEASPAAS